MKKIIFFISILCFSLSGFSQNMRTGNTDINQDDLKEIEQIIKKKVLKFQRYVNHLAGNSLSHEQKMGDYNNALLLFIGEGEPYEQLTPTHSGGYETEWHEAVKMITINSKYSQRKTSRPMKEYLYKLITDSENPQFRYRKVVIEGSDAIRVDNIQQLGDGRYIALAHYMQKYTGFGTSEIKPMYTDYTGKQITIYIRLASAPSPDGVKTSWTILFGDVDSEDCW